MDRDRADKVITVSLSREQWKGRRKPSILSLQKKCIMADRNRGVGGARGGRGRNWRLRGFFPEQQSPPSTRGDDDGDDKGDGNDGQDNFDDVDDIDDEDTQEHMNLDKSEGQSQQGKNRGVNSGQQRGKRAARGNESHVIGEEFVISGMDSTSVGVDTCVSKRVADHIKLISKEVMGELAEEGISEIQVMKLLEEMEMADENGENIWDEDNDTDVEIQRMDGRDTLKNLPQELMPSVQEFVEESQGGFSIPEYKEQREGGSVVKMETGLG
jgi:hypothetical protein